MRSPIRDIRYNLGYPVAPSVQGVEAEAIPADLAIPPDYESAQRALVPASASRLAKTDDPNYVLRWEIPGEKQGLGERLSLREIDKIMAEGATHNRQLVASGIPVIPHRYHSVHRPGSKYGKRAGHIYTFSPFLHGAEKLDITNPQHLEPALLCIEGLELYTQYLMRAKNPRGLWDAYKIYEPHPWQKFTTQYSVVPPTETNQTGLIAHDPELFIADMYKEGRINPNFSKRLLQFGEAAEIVAANARQTPHEQRATELQQRVAQTLSQIPDRQR